MKPVNIEIKARCDNPSVIREILKSKNAIFKGTDNQIDIYFNVKNGRLKLREGEIEKNLIYYQREEKNEPKHSEITLIKSPDKELKEILSKAIGILIIVDKKREIYSIDNVKFQIDSVNGLGNFMEIEEIDYNGDIGKDKLLEQCNYYMQLLEINEKDLIKNSYSDMLLEKEAI